MRSPLAVNRPHTTVTVNWRKGRGKAAKNAIKRMHDWLNSTVATDPLAEKRRIALQNGGLYEIQTTSHEVTEEEKARRAAELKRQRQERDAKEQVRKEAQRKVAEEKARKKKEEAKQRKAAEEEEHRKWQEEVRRKEEEEKQRKAEEERLKKEKKEVAAAQAAAKTAEEERLKKEKKEAAAAQAAEEERLKKEKKEAAAAKAAEEEKAKKEKSKKEKQSKNKKMSESEKAAPVEEPVAVVQQQHQEAAVPIISDPVESKPQQNAVSESAAVVQDEAAAPEESKSSKKNKKNKKHSESEPVAEVRRETIVESIPPPAAETEIFVINEQSDKKSKKNKKDKKHSESERAVEAQTEAAIEAIPVPAEDVPESLPSEPISASIEDTPTPTSTPAEPVEPVVEKSDKKSKKNKKDKKHSESEQTVTEKMETVVESVPPPLEDAPVAHAHHEHTDKKSKKNKKDKKHSESEPTIEETKETVVESVPPVVEESQVAAEPSHEHQKKSKKNKKDKKHSESESSAKIEQTPSADVEEPCIAIVLPPSQEENAETAVEATSNEPAAVAHEEKADKKKKSRNKKHSESKANGHVPNGAPASHVQEIVQEPSVASEDKTPAPPQTDDSLDFLDFVTPKAPKEEAPSDPTPPAIQKTVAQVEPASTDDGFDFLDFVTPKADKEDSDPVAAPHVEEVHVAKSEAEQPVPEDSFDFLDFVTPKAAKEEVPAAPVQEKAQPEPENQSNGTSHHIESENEPSTSGVEERKENVAESNETEQVVCQTVDEKSEAVYSDQPESACTDEYVAAIIESVVNAALEPENSEEQNAESNSTLVESVQDEPASNILAHSSGIENQEESSEEIHTEVQISCEDIAPCTHEASSAEQGEVASQAKSELAEEPAENQELSHEAVHEDNEPLLPSTKENNHQNEGSEEVVKTPQFYTLETENTMSSSPDDSDFEKIQIEEVENHFDNSAVEQNAQNTEPAVEATGTEQIAESSTEINSESEALKVPMTVEVPLPTVEIPVTHSRNLEPAISLEDGEKEHHSSEVPTTVEEPVTIPMTVEAPFTQVVEIAVEHTDGESTSEVIEQFLEKESASEVTDNTPEENTQALEENNKKSNPYETSDVSTIPDPVKITMTVEAPCTQVVEIAVEHVPADVEESEPTTENSKGSHEENKEINSNATPDIPESATILMTVEAPCTQVFEIAVEHISTEENSSENQSGAQSTYDHAANEEIHSTVKATSTEHAYNDHEYFESADIPMIEEIPSYSMEIDATECKYVPETESQEALQDASSGEVEQVAENDLDRETIVEEAHLIKEQSQIENNLQKNSESTIIPLTVDAPITTVVEIPVKFSHCESESEQSAEDPSFSIQVHHSTVVEVPIPLEKSEIQEEAHNQEAVAEPSQVTNDHQPSDISEIPIVETLKESVVIQMIVEAPFTQVVEIAVIHELTEDVKKENSSEIQEDATESPVEPQAEEHVSVVAVVEEQYPHDEALEEINAKESKHQVQEESAETFCEQSSEDTTIISEEGQVKERPTAETEAVMVPMTVDAPCNQIVAIEVKYLQEDHQPAEASLEIQDASAVEQTVNEEHLSDPTHIGKEHLSAQCETDSHIEAFPEESKPVEEPVVVQVESQVEALPEESFDEQAASPPIEPEPSHEQEFKIVELTTDAPITDVVEIPVKHVDVLNETHHAETVQKATTAEVTSSQQNQPEEIVSDEKIEELKHEEVAPSESPAELGQENAETVVQQEVTEASQQDISQVTLQEDRSQPETHSFEQHYDEQIEPSEIVGICKPTRSVEVICASEIPLSEEQFVEAAQEVIGEGPPVESSQDSQCHKVDEPVAIEKQVEPKSNAVQHSESSLDRVEVPVEEISCEKHTEVASAPVIEHQTEIVQDSVAETPVERQCSTEAKEISVDSESEVIHSVSEQAPASEVAKEEVIQEQTSEEMPALKSLPTEIPLSFENQPDQIPINGNSTETFIDAVESFTDSAEIGADTLAEYDAVEKKESQTEREKAAENVEESSDHASENESQSVSEVVEPSTSDESPVECIHSIPENVEPIADTNACEGETCENSQNEVSETNKGVELETRSESRSEFVISEHGSETVAQEHETIVTVVVTEAPAAAVIPESIADAFVVAPNAPESSTHTELNDQNSVEESFTKVHTDGVNAAQKDETVQKEEADSTHGKSGKNKKKNKKNRNSKSITETQITDISIAEMDKHADAEVAALNPGSASPPIQVNEITSTEHVENGHKETIETIISQHIVDQKDVSPTRFAQNVQALVEKTLKQAHPGVEIDPNVKMQIDIQLQKLAERRPVVEARNVITPLPLQLHLSRPTTPINRERLYKLLPKDIIFCSGLIDAHGENYNAMAADARNIYRENARGLQRKIRIFKESPHFQTYLKAKEEGITVEALLEAEAAH